MKKRKIQKNEKQQNVGAIYADRLIKQKKNDSNVYKQHSGITLVALVVTIVVLLILAGISITTVLGDSGLINKANEVKFKSEVAQIKENLEMYVLNKKLGENSNKESVNGSLVNNLGNSQLYIDYGEKLIIRNSKLVYTGSSNLERKWCEDLGIGSIEISGIEDKIALLIDSDFNDAVEKGEITKYQYPYQITGTLKFDIESKLGRDIDYSKDRFYIVNCESVMPEEKDKKYIYNASEKIVVEVKEQTHRKKATWFWQSNSALDQAIMAQSAVQDEFFEKLEFYEISEIYLMVNTNRLVGNTKIENFVRNAYNRDIKVYIVIGERNYLGKDSWNESIYQAYDALNQYNQSVEYSKRIAGINYDAEVWLNSDYDWWNNNETRRQHIEYIQEAKKYADSKGLEAIFTLPFWYVQCNYNDTDNTEHNMYDKVTQILDEVTLMLYRDTAEQIKELTSGIQVNATESIINYTEKNDCILNIGIETGETGEGDYTTFYEEETTTKGYINSELQKLEETYNTMCENFLFSIHHAINLVKFLGDIEVENTIKISTAQELKDFLADDTGMKEKTIELTTDIDMQGYEVTPYGNGRDIPFCGTFDGKNHTIENLSINTTIAGGIFTYIEQGAVVKNLNIKNSTIVSTGYNIGGISGVNWGTIINCANINTSVKGKQYVGGIVGRNYSILENCYNTGDVESTEYYVGGIAGKADYYSGITAKIYNVYNVGKITEGKADGSRGGITSQNSGIIENAYWLEGSCDMDMGYGTDTDTETIKMTEEEMKSSNFKDLLNTNATNNTNNTLKQWTQDDQNSGYPHF